MILFERASLVPETSWRQHVGFVRTNSAQVPRCTDVQSMVGLRSSFQLRSSLESDTEQVVVMIVLRNLQRPEWSLDVWVSCDARTAYVFNIFLLPLRGRATDVCHCTQVSPFLSWITEEFFQEVAELCDGCPQFGALYRDASTAGSTSLRRFRDLCVPRWQLGFASSCVRSNRASVALHYVHASSWNTKFSVSRRLVFR